MLKPPETSARLAFGDFELDPRAGELSLGGQPVAVGARAVDVLCLLAAARGGLVTKDELITGAGPGVVVEDNNLHVQVSALRRALARGGGRDWLRTVPGRGYRFVAPLRPAADPPARPAVPGRGPPV